MVPGLLPGSRERSHPLFDFYLAYISPLMAGGIGSQCSSEVPNRTKEKKKRIWGKEKEGKHGLCKPFCHLVTDLHFFHIF